MRKEVCNWPAEKGKNGGKSGKRNEETLISFETWTAALCLTESSRCRSIAERTREISARLLLLIRSSVIYLASRAHGPSFTVNRVGLSMATI